MARRSRGEQVPASPASQTPGRWRRFLTIFGPYLWAYRYLIALSYGCSMVSILAVILLPWPLKIIIDYVISGRPLPAFLQPLYAGASPDVIVLGMTVTFIGFTTLDAVAGVWQKVLNARVRERLTLDLRDCMLGHLHTLPPTIRTLHRSGELVLRLVGDVDLFVRLQTKTLPLLFEHTVNAIMTLGVMFWMEPLLGYIGVGIIPPLVYLAQRYRTRLGSASRRKRRYEGEVAGLAQEIVRGLPVIQALGSEQQARQRFAQLNTKSLQAGVEEARVGAGMERTLQIAQGLAMALISGGGALLVLRGHLTLGTLTVCVSYIVRLLKPVEKINELASNATRGLASGERLLALLAQPSAVQDAPDAVVLPRAQGVLEWQDVWFSYPAPEGRSAAILRGIHWRLEPGRLAVLVGPSGAGKSTMLSLIVRLFDPTSGQIVLDGYPLPCIALRSLRQQIAVMTQDTHLFAGPLYSALVPHDLQASTARIWEALALVGLEEFVRSLPEQLHTILGEDGVNVSGGQRQRLSLARAFLLDRPILLLDEPLANVDAASEAMILNALERLRVGRTCLAITHRLSLLERADVVYRLEAGQIIEQNVRALLLSHEWRNL